VLRTWGISWELREPTVLVRWHLASETHRFKTGIDDLEETLRLLEQLPDVDHPEKPRSASARQSGRQVLARAYLNRSYDALHNGQLELARSCLTRAWGLSPRRVITTLGTDPRFCLQTASLALAPRTAARWFARGQ
jgi:hypothetical protein